MKGTYSTLGLVVSRIGFDKKRHVVAASAVMILMASFLTFNAVAAGLDEGIHQTILDEGHNQINLLHRGGFNADAVTFEPETVAAWNGVESVSARGATGTGIEIESSANARGGNATSEIVLVQFQAAIESKLVGQSTETQTGFQGGRGFASDSYRLVAGHWIESASEAVVTQSVADAGYGIGEAFETGDQVWTIVGIIQNGHPAAVQPPGIIAEGHVLVDGAGGDVLGMHVQIEPEFFAIQSTVERIITEYPQAAFGLDAQLAELESQHFDAAQTQSVLAAAARLVAAAGVAAVFAMSLFLLIAERKAFGTMSGIGFGRGRIGSYMAQKMAYVTLFGALAGGIIGWLVIQAIPAPQVSFAFEPALDAGAWGIASFQTLGAAIVGSLAAFTLTIRQDPIQALRATE